MFHNPLILLIVGPVIAGAICLSLPDRVKIFIKLGALLVCLASFAAAIHIFLKKPIVYNYGSYTVLLADNLSGFIAVAIAAFALLITIYSFGFIERSFGRYFGYTLMTLGASMGAVFANDMIVLLTFWGVLVSLLYLMVNLKGTDDSAAAAKKSLIIIGGTDALMLFGLCLVWSMTKTFMISGLRIPLSSASAYIAYFSLAIAAFAKAGAMPFHSWLPDVAEFAPASVTAYLPASLDKLLGIYLLARISLSLFAVNRITNTVLAVVGAVTIVLAVIIALVQHDMKRLLGYHAVSQVGYMVLGIGTGNPIGIAGGLFHMLNNVIYKSCLFLSAGSVEKRCGTTDLDKLGGLAKYMPVTFAAFLTASLSISGVPPFNGFVSKWMIYQGIIESASPKNPLWIVWLVSAMFGSALTVASFMKLLHAVFLGRPDTELKDVKEAGFSMSFPVIVLALVCVIFGVLAFILPLPILIAPAIGLSIVYLGSWSPVIATILIIIGITAGLFVYSVFRSKKTFRTVQVFIGGEDVGTLGRISGTDFYNTIKDVKALGGIYKKEASGNLDLYNITRNAVYYFTRQLQRLHNGVLPTYLVWCLLGMIGMFLVIFVR